MLLIPLFGALIHGSSLGYILVVVFNYYENRGLLNGRMVHVMKGYLVECDQAMKQFLLHLDETLALGEKFIIQDLDDTHLFISSSILQVLQLKVDDLIDQISAPITEK